MWKLTSLILFLFVFASCKDNVTNPYTNGDILPLNDGNQWIYELNVYDSTGKNIVLTSLDTMYIGAKDSSGDYIIKSFFATSPDIYLRSNNDGISYSTLGLAPVLDSNGVQIPDSMEFKEIICLLFKYPKISSGLVYLVQDPYSMKIESVNTSVVTKIGKFKCCVYKNYNHTKSDMKPSSKHYYYLSPGVGIVKYELYEESNINKILKKSYILIQTNVI